MAATTLVIGVFTSVALQQYAAQQFYGIAYADTKPFASWVDNKVPLQTIKPATETKPAAASSPLIGSPVTPTPAASPKATTKTTTAPANTAAPAPAPAPAPAAPSGPVSDIASEAICPGQGGTANASAVLACMAAYARTQNGLSAVTNNSSLQAAAEAKVQDMVNCGYSHTACGRAFNYWFAPKGYTGRCMAENIAKGQTSIGQVFTAWMNSAGHRANILNASYKHIGSAYSPTNKLWAMELGGC